MIIGAQDDVESHPWIGLAIPVGTALDAYSIVRLFARIFLGSHQQPATGIPDGLFRQRIPLTAIVLVLIGLGLYPQLAIELRASAAHTLQQVEGGAGDR